MSGQFADQIIGDTPEAKAQRAWHHVYRALNHGFAKKQCDDIRTKNGDLNFPEAIEDAATRFLALQQKRHDADYDISKPTSATDVRQHIAEVRSIIDRFEAVENKHRKAFAVWLLINKRRAT